ncbi:MAG: hypothetical protein IJV48_07250 [Ruminococcus sp.]|nr:hypothetical protein [Ruminococcus sp.]
MYRAAQRKDKTDITKALLSFSSEVLLFMYYTKYPLNALTNLLVENFAEQGEGRRHTGVCQGRQRSYAEFNAINVKVF